eukprot:5729339-Prymnesium_polylepis.1
MAHDTTSYDTTARLAASEVQYRREDERKERMVGARTVGAYPLTGWSTKIHFVPVKFISGSAYETIRGYASGVTLYHFIDSQPIHTECYHHRTHSSQLSAGETRETR